MPKYGQYGRNPQNMEKYGKYFLLCNLRWPFVLFWRVQNYFQGSVLFEVEPYYFGDWRTICTIFGNLKIFVQEHAKNSSKSAVFTKFSRVSLRFMIKLEKSFPRGQKRGKGGHHMNKKRVWPFLYFKKRFLFLEKLSTFLGPFHDFGMNKRRVSLFKIEKLSKNTDMLKSSSELSFCFLSWSETASKY